MSDNDQTYDLPDRGDDRPGLEDIDALEVDDFDEDDDDDAADDMDDAEPDEIDFVIALYREDGDAQAETLPKDLANDLDMLIEELRRYPGDSGVLGMVSIDGEFFVLVRVRGRNVQVLLSDDGAAEDYPIARDVADFLGEDLEEDDESAPMGDFDMLADLGCSEFDLEQLAGDYEEDSDALCQDIADRIKMGEQFAEVTD